jgi:hypothetical protein
MMCEEIILGVPVEQFWRENLTVIEAVGLVVAMDLTETVTATVAKETVDRHTTANSRMSFFIIL